MQLDCLQQLGLQTRRNSQQEWLLKTLDVQQVDGALLLLECSEEGLEALVLCEAFVGQATPLEMEQAGPHPLQLARMLWLVVVGECWGSLVLASDQPMKHPEQLASEDNQC